MDILKILSRSTKHPNKASLGKDAASKKLPSSGTSANPQLYHDEIPESRGKKRKRGADKGEEQAPDQEGDAIDFFAPKSSVPKLKTKDLAAPVLESKLRQASSQSVGKLLDEGECRQILRSHRLKATILPAPKLQPKKVKKSKKTKASKKVETHKEEYKQVYPQPLVAFGDLRTVYGISGRMAGNLVDQGIALNGVVLISTILYFETSSPGMANQYDLAGLAIDSPFGGSNVVGQRIQSVLHFTYLDAFGLLERNDLVPVGTVGEGAMYNDDRCTVVGSICRIREVACKKADCA